jgi:hypothetical protein
LHALSLGHEVSYIIKSPVLEHLLQNTIPTWTTGYLELGSATGSMFTTPVS